MTVLGYVRVSTARQVNDRQRDTLTAHGVDRIFEDTVTGARFDRAGLTAMLDYARGGDTVVVASLDRLGRSLSQVVACADELHRRGIVLKSLKESIDYSSSTGRMLAGIFASLAEYERVLINERAADARTAAAARGKHTGRPKALTPQRTRDLLELHATGDRSISELATSFEISRATVYRILQTQPAPATVVDQPCEPPAPPPVRPPATKTVDMPKTTEKAPAVRSRRTRAQVSEGVADSGETTVNPARRPRRGRPAPVDPDTVRLEQSTDSGVWRVLAGDTDAPVLVGFLEPTYSGGSKKRWIARTAGGCSPSGVSRVRPVGGLGSPGRISGS